MSHGQNYPTQPAPAGAAPAGGAVPNGVLAATIVGSALAALGSFLPFSALEGGNSGGMEGDGLFILLAALVTLGLAVGGLVTKNAKIAMAAAVPALVVAIFGVLNVISPDRALRGEAESEGASAADIDEVLAFVDVSVGIGIWLVLLGGLVALGSAAFVGVKSRG
ncbi:hypothetical protein [Streptomyces mayteni]